MEQKSKESWKIRIISLADNLVQLVFSYVPFNRFVNGKIVERIEMIARYYRALIFQRKIIFLQPANFLYNQRFVFYKGIYENSTKEIREFCKNSC